MRILLKNHLENAIEALRSNRFRTCLTMVGVTIGMAGITTILSISGGVQRIIGTPAADPKQLALIRSGGEPATSSIANSFQNQALINSLTEKDAEAIAKIPHSATTPMALIHTNIATPNKRDQQQKTTLVGCYPSLKSIAGLEVKEGQFIDEANGIVLGQQLAVDLFGTEHALGNVLKIRGENLTVIGILKPTKSPTSQLGIDFSSSAILPISVVKSFTENVAQIQQIAVTAPDESSFRAAITKAEEILKLHHHGDLDYRILTGDAISAPAGQIVNALITTIAIVSGLSLFIGGIGIMNIMLVHVAERQREVGIRKAVGATNNHIIHQFLIEAAIIGCLGGLAGFGIGLLGALFVSSYLPFTITVQWQTAALSVILAVAIGILFGAYPAIRATRQDPIESLKY